MAGLRNAGPALVHTTQAAHTSSRLLQTNSQGPTRQQGFPWEQARTDSKQLAIALQTLLSLCNFPFLC